MCMDSTAEVAPVSSMRHVGYGVCSGVNASGYQGSGAL